MDNTTPISHITHKHFEEIKERLERFNPEDFEAHIGPCMEYRPNVQSNYEHNTTVGFVVFYYKNDAGDYLFRRRREKVSKHYFDDEWIEVDLCARIDIQELGFKNCIHLDTQYNWGHLFPIRYEHETNGRTYRPKRYYYNVEHQLLIVLYGRPGDDPAKYMVEEPEFFAIPMTIDELIEQGDMENEAIYKDLHETWEYYHAGGCEFEAPDEIYDQDLSEEE